MRLPKDSPGRVNFTNEAELDLSVERSKFTDELGFELSALRASLMGRTVRSRLPRMVREEQTASHGRSP